MSKNSMATSPLPSIDQNNISKVEVETALDSLIKEKEFIITPVSSFINLKSIGYEN